jgi:predicted transcriptional regulator
MKDKQNRKLKAIAIVMRALSNETRLSILNLLYKKPKTWTELQFELKLNSKSLRDHLQYLRDSNLVRKRRPVGFELTEAGKALLELSMKDILEATEIDN